MGRFTHIDELSKCIRRTREYTEWVQRNKALTCYRCNGTDKLQVHHIPDLYTLLQSYWKFYGDWDFVYNHILAKHANDEIENATFCHNCHNGIHPGRVPLDYTVKQVDCSSWTIIPRSLDLKFSQGTRKPKPGTVGLIAFQTLMGLGWQILNDGSQALPMIQFKRQEFAHLLHKTPGNSFNKSLDEALGCLKDCGIVAEFIIKNGKAEIHLLPEYMQELKDNPWFLKLGEMLDSRMPVISLKWFLSFQNDRKAYRIGWEKLAIHLGYETTEQWFMKKSILQAAEQIKGCKVSCVAGIFTFIIKSGIAVPIHALRKKISLIEF